VSTRSVIARRTNGGWSGVYHHWDGYPSGLGAHLWKLLRDRYAGDVERLLAEVVDAHPGGWSHLMGGSVLQPARDRVDLRFRPVLAHPGGPRRGPCRQEPGR